MTEEVSYVVTMTLTSIGKDEDVAVQIRMNPDLAGVNIQELGFLPASFKFLETYIMPALNEAYVESEVADLLDAESPSNRSH